MDLSQYNELATFAQFATDLDAVTRDKIERGKRIVEILKQEQYSPYPVQDEVLVIYLATSGALDDFSPELIREFEKNFLAFLYKKYKDLPEEIEKYKEIDDNLEKKLVQAISEFKADFSKTHLVEGRENG